MNIDSIPHRAAWLLLLIVGLLVAFGASAASAGAANGPTGKINICHATSSTSNPYTRISVSTNGLNGHGAHGGDIIPAPSSGCPTSVSNCAGAGLPCAQVPMLPTPLLGLLAAVIGIAGALGIRMWRRKDLDSPDGVHPEIGGGTLK